MPSMSDYEGLLEALTHQGFQIDARQCLSIRNRNVHCTRCADACVSGCISIADDQISIDAQRCIGCGTCATACPTSAIGARNPDDKQIIEELLTVMEHNAGTVVVACSCIMEKVKGRIDPESVAKVACLGRLEESILTTVAAAGAQKIVLVSDECAGCTYAKGSRTVAQVVASAQSILQAWNSPCKVKLSCRKLPRICALEGAQQYDAQRRDFLLGLGGLAKSSGKEATMYMVDRSLGASEETPVHEHVTADGTLPHYRPLRRILLMNALEQIGQPSPEATVESRLWRHVSIDPQACTGCQMCAVFCPSAALAKHIEYEEAPKPLKMFRAHGNNRTQTIEVAPEVKHVDLRHAPSLCLGCGTCVQVCPAHAVHLDEEVNAADLTAGYVETINLRDRFKEIGGPDGMKNAMSKLINSTYIWG